MIFEKEWNVVFLLDSLPPTHIALLRRGDDRPFAPGVHTGLGGKTNTLKESIIEGAERELREETGEKEIELHEFARCIIVNRNRALYYLWGLYGRKNLPLCNEGDLKWVEIDKFLTEDIIPTTRAVITEWVKRNLTLKEPFTVFINESRKDSRGLTLPDIKEVREGLFFE